jgi:hypothetical protein
MTANYSKYSLYIDSVPYQVNYIIPTNDNSTVLTLGVDGNPFNGIQNSTDYLVIRPNDMEVNRVFIEDLDQVENFLLNRNMVPIYSAYFQVPIENEDGTYSYSQEVAIFPLLGTWNLDIVSPKFTNYLTKLNMYVP